MSIKQTVLKKLRDEQALSGLDVASFVAELDKAARPRVGAAYQFGSVIAELTTQYNKESVCRIIRQYRKDHRQS